MPPTAAALAKAKRQRFELAKCKKDLWYLLTAYLGYGWNPKAGRYGKGLTECFHRPICDWLDSHRDKPFLGMWFQRGQHKTTIVVGQIIQQYLIEPNRCILYWHAVDDRASEVADEVAKHMLQNSKLRSLDPVGTYPGDYFISDLRDQRYRLFPHSRVKRWHNSSGFTLSARHNDYSIRFRSLLARGAGSETTGAHGDIAFLDDPIGKNDIEDNQLPKKAAWFQNTVIPVVDGLTIRVTGTPWSDWGMYQDWQESKDWYTLSVPGSTKDAYVDNVLNLGAAVDWTQQKIHLEPDYSLEHPVHGLPEDRAVQVKRLELLKRQMKSQFGPQVMVDPSPGGEKPWDKKLCEHFIGLKADGDMPGVSGPGVIFVLSDPAPMYVGSADGVKQKSRGDGTKDFWSLAVVKLRIRGEVEEVILLDGSASRSWTTDDGMDEACRLMRKWATRFCIHEAYGGLSQKYDDEMAKAVRRNAVAWMRYDYKGNPIQFKNSYASGAKNNRFGDLAAMAKDRRFYICGETCPDEFLYGETKEAHAGFLPQAREWRPLEKGRNSLRYDDHADSVSRCTDSALQPYIPISDGVSYFDELEYQEEEAAGHRRSRYCAI